MTKYQILEKEVKSLRVDNAAWRNKFYAEEKLRINYEHWIKSKFNWWLELATSNSSPSLKYLIKNTAIILGMKDFS